MSSLMYIVFLHSFIQGNPLYSPLVSLTHAAGKKTNSDIRLDNTAGQKEAIAFNTAVN